MSSKITISDLVDAKCEKQKIVAVSCYDYTTARLMAQTDVQMIIVGDSAAQLMLGFDSTLPATMDFMVAITAAVGRGTPDAYLVADMPFLSYQVGINDAVRNAGRFVVEGRAQMVKIEAGRAHLNVVKAVSEAGIAVMAHLGIRPQSISKVGKFKAQGVTSEMALELISLCEQMVYAGASSLLLEGVAAEVAQIITERFEVPVIGCGSGSGCDGQVLVGPDVLGLTQGASAKFVKRYGNLAEAAITAVNAYSDEIVAGKYPDKEHSYHMKKEELEKLRRLL